MNRTRSQRTHQSLRPILVAAGGAILLLAAAAKGATNNVASIAALQTAISGAAVGDVIVLADGAYSNSIISLNKDGITVQAANAGGVFLNGSNNITITANRTTFSGFQFTSGTMTTIPIQVTGSQNLLTQLNFDGYSAQKYINVQAPSQSNQITFCNFENKPTSAPIGNLVHFGADVSVVGYHKIRYCSFQNMPGAGGDNGNECIRLSNGAQSTYVARTVVEYCYFNNTGTGDSEAVSVKCRGNVLRYNTFTNNPDAMMVFRNGNDNVAYGNFFIGAGGIRVKEANNIYCYNNYFENSGVGGTMNAVTYDFISPNLSNINFIHNTFVQCGLIDLSSGAVSNTWANNLFKKSSGNIFAGSSAGISWAGNLYTNTLGISIPSGITKVDPKLVINADGYYGLASNSPAIDAASSDYPAIYNIPGVDNDPSLLLDISGQSRPASTILKDVGCDEYGTNASLNRPLKLSDVGPSYLGGPGTVPLPVIAVSPQSQTANLGAPVSFSVVATNTSPLNFQWRKDGTNIVGATATNYNLAAAQTTNAGNYTVVVTNVTGSVTSVVATLTVNIPPAITSQPQSQSVNVGAPVSFSVVATNTAPFGYQWRQGGTNIAGATTTNYSLASVQLTNAGDYTVVVTNVAGSVTSAVATLTVYVPPGIATEPQSQTVNAGSPASFWVAATGTVPLSYQWRKSGGNLAGANAATNSFAAAQSPNAGDYTVIVTNVAGSITSAVATLTVLVAPPLITGVAAEPNGGFGLSGTGPVGEAYRVLAATNVELPLVNWPVVATGVFTGGEFTFTDQQATNHLQRFYRVVTP